MKIHKIEDYTKPRVPNKIAFLIFIGMLTFTLNWSVNIEIIKKDTIPPDTLSHFYIDIHSPVTETIISYSVKNIDEKPDLVNISIYNLKRELVRTLYDDFQVSGDYILDWDGKNNKGELVKASIFIYFLKINDKITATKKVLLFK